MSVDPLELVRQRLEEHGCDPRADGSISARCPAHRADRNPSLSVGLGDDARVLLNCHRGCLTEDVVAELGLTWADLYPERSSRNGRGEINAFYGYLDEYGELLYKVVRCHPKRFSQRRQDGDGGWIWKLDRTRRVLFRLPNVIGAIAAGETIYVAEGEKDVIALERAGAVATCNSGGAGKWRPEHTEALRGADVVIVRDVDPPHPKTGKLTGQEHAKAVAEALKGVARSVRVVEPVGGGDASDRLAAGHGLDEFVLVAGEREASTPPLVIRASGVKSRSLRWAWEGRMAIGYLTVQTGIEGIGKSVFDAWAISRWTRGDLPGWPLHCDES